MLLVCTVSILSCSLLPCLQHEVQALLTSILLSTQALKHGNPACFLMTSLCITLVLVHRNMFDKEMISKMKKGAFLVNTARGGIADKDAVVEALESGQLGGKG